MQDLLTITTELLVIVPILFLALDFASGLMHLYNAGTTTFQEDKPEEAIAIVPNNRDPKGTAPLSDPWEGEGDKAISQPCCCQQEASPVIYLLPPAMPEVIEQSEINYSGWTIRALKKEAQNRRLSNYSSLTKNQLISRLTAA